jgi:HSP20 family protein
MLWADPYSQRFSQLHRTAAFVPMADLAISENDAVLTLDLPGLTPGEVAIDVEDGQLTVRGERKRPQVGDGTSYAYVQRPFGAFEHRIGLPKGVDPDSITASMKDGVLSLIVPKPERLKPQRIAVRSKEEKRQLEPAAT